MYIQFYETARLAAEPGFGLKPHPEVLDIIHTQKGTSLLVPFWYFFIPRKELGLSLSGMNSYPRKDVSTFFFAGRSRLIKTNYVNDIN